FDHALVADAGIDAAAQVGERVELALPALLHDRFDRLRAHVLDRGQAEPDRRQAADAARVAVAAFVPAVFAAANAFVFRRSSATAVTVTTAALAASADRREQHAALVHVRRQHADAHMAAFVDV